MFGMNHPSSLLYYQLRQLRPAVRYASKTVQAFVSCRLDYCNSLFFCISDGLTSRLQSVQNAAARLVTGTRRCDHITPVPRLLHWLTVRQRVDFKVATVVHRLLRNSASYLADDCRSDVVPRGTASSRGSLEAEFSLPWPRPRSRFLMSWSWPRSRLICLGLATASRHQSQRSRFYFCIY